MTVTETLQQITSLFEQQLQILKVLNDSFFTKQSHLEAVVGDTRYVIPSFLSLENKINFLQDAFNNLVNAPQTGEAWYNFDGNSRAIEVRGYQAAPNPIHLTVPTQFGTEEITRFKDMMSPSPYVYVDLSDIPDDIHQVVVRKIIPYNDNLISYFKSKSSPEWIDVYGYFQGNRTGETTGGTATAMIEGTDYIMYDSVYDLPIRRMTCSGEYVVTEIVEDKITENIEEWITVKISEDTPLKYKFADGTTEDDLAVGDILTNYNGSCRLKIIDMNTAAMQMTLLVMSGEFINIIPAGDDEEISDYSKLRFYRAADFSKDKYIHIPLEEDQYVCIFVAPLNSRMNVQSEWGTGMFLDVDSLTITIDGNTTDFRTYYEQNVQNVGDTLNELAAIMPYPITKFTADEYSTIVSASPELDENNLAVIQVNKHLNDAETVQNIRSLYKQKQQYKVDLQTVQDKIAALQAELAAISFDDMSGTRSMYTAQITDLKNQQNDLNKSISKATESIAEAANDAEIPIEEAKFRIRGYLDVEQFLTEIDGNGDGSLVSLSDVIGIQVEYRYKNPDIPQANVQPIGGDNFIFTEWNRYQPPLRARNMRYENGKYYVNYDDVDTDGKFKLSDNNNKFNQIDIPISQGETVDIRVRVVYAFGYPFMTTTSSWSRILNVEFPPELVKDVEVITIIEENNSDIETNRFNTILDNKGVTEHVGDELMDQDIKYFHRPENISSGFYTSERRVIPLRDKLQDLDNRLTEAMDALLGSTSDVIQVTFTVNDITTTLQPDIDNTVLLPAYSSIIKGSVQSGSIYKDDSGAVIASGMLTITNISSHSVRLFSLFPAARDKFVGGQNPYIMSGGEVDDAKIIHFNTSVDDVMNFKCQITDFDDLGGAGGEDAATNNAYIFDAATRKLVVTTSEGDTSGMPMGITGDDGALSDILAGGRIPLYGVDPSTGFVLGYAAYADNGDIYTAAGAFKSVADGTFKDAQTRYAGQTVIKASQAGNFDNPGLWDGNLNNITLLTEDTIGQVVNTEDYLGPCILYSDIDAIVTVDVDLSVKNEIPEGTANMKGTGINWQRGNQLLYFRTTNPYDGSRLSPALHTIKEQFQWYATPGSVLGVVAYPYVNSKYALCLDSDAVSGYRLLNSSESIAIPINVVYKLTDSSISIVENAIGETTPGQATSNALTESSYTIGFNIRNSLYSDPLYYQFTLVARYNQSTSDTLQNARTSVKDLTKYNVTVR